MGTSSDMRVLIATDAGALQVDGVVRTPTPRARTAPRVGPEIVALSPERIPNRTDTCGVVQLDVPACGVPVAAVPVTGPRDGIGDPAIGVLDEGLRAARLGALRISRTGRRAWALARGAIGSGIRATA
ncbi:hypothetical protein [Methylobacterium sp. TER-1]|uniref:Uncharacterized protein n=1 Tax=Methylobacterium oryzihabitans TaxID=2499852 RepID=A0A3S2VMU9_9HYPH|nr:hypothetical protein EOE48_17015 [Methylobacterium oryzihabitans]